MKKVEKSLRGDRTHLQEEFCHWKYGYNANGESLSSVVIGIKWSVVARNGISTINCREDGWSCEPRNGAYALSVLCDGKECDWRAKTLPGPVSDVTHTVWEKIREFATGSCVKLLRRSQARHRAWKSVRTPQLAENILCRRED